MFLSRNKENNVYPCKPQFYYIKVGFKGVNIIYACFRDAFIRPQGFLGTGKQGHLFLEQGNRNLKMKVMGTKAILGNRECRKSRFCIWGTRESDDFFQRNQGTGTH